MTRIYSYPRVNTSVTALVHSNALPEAKDTTVLFVPFVSERGPVNEVVKIHSLEEFQTTFGEIKNYYTRIGKNTAFMIMNWLSAGGTIYAVRLSGKSGEKKGAFKDKENKLQITAKEYGAYVNSLKLSYTFNNKRLSVSVKNSNNVVIERFYVNNITETGEYKITASEYFDKVNIIAKPADTDKGECTISAADYGADGLENEESFDDLLEEFWKIDSTPNKIKSTAENIIANPLETPIDLIMDAGYSDAVKTEMAEFVAEHDKTGVTIENEKKPVRSDIRAIIEVGKDTDATEIDISNLPHCPNVFYYWDQGFTITDGVFSNDEIKVGPSYFLASLIPSNDISNGIQFPVAGTRRGELSGVTKLDHNPMPNDKETLFSNHINYVEKDSRGMYFMNQRTSETIDSDSFTALAFINNSRVVCRMVHEIERLGRDYLFEFNDSTTLSNMRSVLNKYVSNWIANRTLSYGSVEVAQSAASEEAVDVTLNIKFTGTIEVISVDIVIE